MMRKKNSGFTLIEVIITIGILSVLSGAFISTVIAGRRLWNIGEARIQLQQELRKGLNEVVEDLSQAVVSTINGVNPDGTPYYTITFRQPIDVINGVVVWGNDTIQYALGGNNGRQLLKTVGVVQTVVTNNIVSFQMRRDPATPSIIEIALKGNKQTVEGNVITTVSSCRVKLRN